MVRFEVEIMIDRPVPEVFAYVTDVSNLPEWQTATTAASWEDPGHVGKGSRIWQATRFLGRSMEMELEVTEYEDGRRFDLRMLTGAFPFDVRHTFTAANGGTRIRLVAEGKPAGFFRLGEGMVRRQAERQSKADFERLKAVIESRSA